MKVTVYTIADIDSPHCLNAKTYLKDKGVQFEEKNVAENRTYLAEMLDVSNKFAGVPVTVVVKDDGVQTVLKGFTEKDYEDALSVSPVSAVQAEETVGAVEDSVDSTTSLTPGDSPLPAATVPDQSGSLPAEEEAKQKINDVLSSLEQKSAATTSNVAGAPTNVAGASSNVTSTTTSTAPAMPQMPQAPAMPTTPEPVAVLPIDTSTMPTMPTTQAPSGMAPAAAPIDPTTPQAPQTGDLPIVPNFTK